MLNPVDNNPFHEGVHVLEYREDILNLDNFLRTCQKIRW